MQLEGHTDTVTTLILSNDENYLFSGSKDMKINMWNLSDRLIEIVF